jgi:hypothetical protein
MSATTAADLYLAIEESARLLGVPCARDRVWPILNAYADALPQAVIAFRVGTGKRYTGDLDWRFTVPTDVDPYAIALSSGLTATTDHPVGATLSDIRERCPIGSYGVDFGVVGGFKKIYAFFPPDDMQRLSTFTGMPSMPPGLTEHVDFFARHGLDGAKVNVFGIDYQHRTVNVYFGALPAKVLTPKMIRSMLHELELPEPSARMLKLVRLAFGIYATLGWDSPRVQRYCFAVMAQGAAALPVRIEGKIERFLKSVPYGADDGRFIYYAGVSSTGEENFKLQSYFAWQPKMLDQMLLSDASGPGD